MTASLKKFRLMIIHSLSVNLQIDCKVGWCSCTCLLNVMGKIEKNSGSKAASLNPFTPTTL